ncbi:MAG: pyridoxamine 5'-phosphate oxidase family protein [Pseudomonadota bacterium]
MQDPVRPADDEARQIAQAVLAEASHAALAVLDPGTGAPSVSRIALHVVAGQLVSLVSDLSTHTTALRADPRVALLVGEPGPKGDPLTHPRMTIDATVRFADRAEAGFADLREGYLACQPKAKLYVDFGDFHFLRFQPTAVALNGGFGKAYRLTPADLGLTTPGSPDHP